MFKDTEASSHIQRRVSSPRHFRHLRHITSFSATYSTSSDIRESQVPSASFARLTHLPPLLPDIEHKEALHEDATTPSRRPQTSGKAFSCRPAATRNFESRDETKRPSRSHPIDRSKALNRAQTRTVGGLDHAGPSKADLPYCTKGRPLAMTWKPISRSPTKPSCGWRSTAGSTIPKGIQSQPAKERCRLRTLNSKERSDHALAKLLISPWEGTETGKNTKTALIATEQRDLPQAVTRTTKSKISVSANNCAKAGFPKTLKSQSRMMKLRVEFKVIIGPQNREEIGTTSAGRFVTDLAQNFNNKASCPLYQMFASMDESPDDPSRWKICLWEELNDPNVEAWFMRLYSPIFIVSTEAMTGIPSSPWRESVREVWTYIDEYYDLTLDDYLGTVIQMSMHPHFTLEEVKRVAQAAIHIEPAMEVIMPVADAESFINTSNWVQSLDFAPSGRFRSDCVDLIETSTSIPTLADMMQRGEPETSFNWDFTGLSQPEGMIKFCRPPPSNDVDETIQHAELTMCLVRAAMRCPKDELQRIPSNVGGLRWFLAHYTVPWLYSQCRQMHRLWSGIPLAAITQLRSFEWTEVERRELEFYGYRDVDEMVREDYRRNVEFAEHADGPWRLLS